MGDDAGDVTHSKELLLELISSDPDNAVCADCGERDPQWASANLGFFICIVCAGIHRNLGTHISRVRSIMLDTWKPEEIEVMKVNGNKRCNDIWQGSLDCCSPIRASDSVALREQWIRAKYVRKLYQKRESGTISTYPIELPTKEGWMTKKGDVVRNWKRRYFKLVGSLLFYYKKDRSIPAGHVFIIESTRAPDCLAEPIPDRPFCFTINTPNRDYYLTADTGEEMYDWVQALRTARQYLTKPSAYGHNKLASDLLSLPNTIPQAVSELSRLATFRRKVGSKVLANCIHACSVVDYLIHIFHLESRQEGALIAKVLLEKGHLRPCQPTTPNEPFLDKSDVLYTINS